MSHEILVRNNKARALYARAEGPGWTNLGAPIDESIADDPRKMLEALGPYRVEKRRIPITLNGITVDMPDRSMLIGVWEEEDTGNGTAAESIIASGGSVTLGGRETFFEVVSEKRYHVENRQPVDILESLRDKLKKQHLKISHAAILKGGRIINVCARMQDLDGAAKLDGDSDRNVYLSASTGYDKQHGTNYFITTIRTVCNNTLEAGLAESAGKGRRQTRTASQSVNHGDLQLMLDAAIETVTADTAAMQAMIEAKLSSGQAREYFARLLDIDTGKLDVRNADGRKLISTRSQNQLDALQSAYVRGPGSDLPAANGTLYGAVNAVTYIVDNESQIRDTMREGNARARMTSATFGAGYQMKQKAVRNASAMLAELLARPVDNRTFSDADGSHDFARLLATG